ncbi:hypothetical protein MKW92_035008 [Papaver armeniacum]|nr:hypothetical protein MKW92_035008 [Papaver armeniacum]
MSAQPVMAVVAGVYVKQYPGLPTEHRHVTREITLPARVGNNQANQSIDDTRKTISQLQETKWDAGYTVLNRKVFRAKAIGISTEKGWYYLGCLNCTIKFVGNIWDHWCLDARSK